MSEKQRVISGIKPTGRLHVGNYIGAMQQFVELQDMGEVYYFIADYHALIDNKNPERMEEYIQAIAMDYLAIGLDPNKVTLFQQSRVSEHTELGWIFNTLAPVAELERAHAYKDAQAKGKDINMGLFDYPVLMAADILMYDIDVVPVGKDQVQHVETARLLAKKFNNAYGETFLEPQAKIVEVGTVVPGLDGLKMGKSDGNAIAINESADEIVKKVMTIPTASIQQGQPIPIEGDILFKLHEIFSHEQIGDLRERYEAGTIGFKESKELLAANIEKVVAPIREKRAEIEKDLSMVKKVLDEGAEKAQERASDKMQDVRKKIGVRPL